MLALLENASAVDLDRTEKYAAILGESPSKGARSPRLWNAAFKELGISATMHPMDVRPEKLSRVVDALRNDHRFIGGAVAVPHKQALLPLLDRVEAEAQAIGAINCIYRDSNKLVGANTDGEGALRSLESVVGAGALHGATVLVIGVGGAGRVVAAYLAGAVGQSGRLILANRTAAKCYDLAETLAACCAIEVTTVPVATVLLEQSHVIVNCSSVGYANPRIEKEAAYLLRPYTPLGPVDDALRVPVGDQIEKRYMQAAFAAIKSNIAASLDALSHVQAQATVFDIIYQPLQTLLLNLAACYGLRTVNGKVMNLEQAVIAFCKATLNAANAEKVRSIMQRV